MFDFTTFTKQFEQATQQATEFFAPKQFKEVQDKSKSFALEVLATTTEATQSNIQAFGKLAGKDADVFFAKASNLVDTTYQYAKEIIETGTIKSVALSGYKK